MFLIKCRNKVDNYYQKDPMAIQIKDYILPLLVLLQLVVDVACHTQPQTIPKPQAQQNFRYIIFSEQCYDVFFKDFNFYHIQCLKFTLSKFLGVNIIIGAMLVKAPQILKIVKKRSTLGVSFQAVLFEEIMLISALAYNIFRQNPFTVYGETIFLGIQMMIIHLLFVIFDKQRRLKAILFLPLVLVYFIAGYFPNLGLFPQYILQHTMMVQIVLMTIARLTQIFEIHRIKSTGSVAFITYALACFGNAMRVFTSLVQVKNDIILVLSFVIALLLNGYICLCFLIFKEPKGEKVEEKKQ